MSYGDAAATKSMLGISGIADDARLAALNAAWSAWFDQRTERTYGHTAEAAVEARPVSGRGGSVLLLPVPVLAVDSVTAGIDTVTDTAPWLENDDGEFWAITRTAGEWPLDATLASVIVTATWADRVIGVPPEVVEAITTLMRYSFMADKAGPSGVVGPDGLELKLPDPTTDERVRLAVRNWRLKSWRPV